MAAGGGGRSRPDPWALLLLLAALPMVLHARATPLGEPFADDFLFLKRVLLPGPRSLLDGGGSPLYWRPVGRQLYYGLLGPLIVSHPRWIAALHVALLAASAWLVYRALRTRWPASWAAAAAAFPLLIDADRMLIAWPSHFQDVGAIFFAALALHEASRSRAWTAAASLLASLLCKEVAACIGLLLPWLPVGPTPTRAWRWRATGVFAAVIAAWGLAYVAVARSAGVEFAHQFGESAAAGPTSPWIRLGWAVGHAARSAMSLPAAPGRGDLGVAAALGVLASAACAAYALEPDARRRLRASVGQVAWGVAWFLAATIPLLEVYPAWSAQRCVFASIGLGVALAGLLAPAHPGLVAGLLALRLVTFQASPSEPRSLAEAGEQADQEFDFRHLVRLQRLVAETRVTLARRFPTLPRGSIVGQHYVPHMVLHAFEGDAALQVWYRDGSLRWMGFDEFRDHPDRELAGFVEHQPHGARQVAFVEADAMRELLAGLALMRVSRWADAMAALGRAEDQQPDTAAAVFLGTIAAKRAVCLSALGRTDDAARAARRALELWPENLDSRVTLASLELDAGRYAEAETLLVDQLRLYPADTGALELLTRVRATWVARTR